MLVGLETHVLCPLLARNIRTNQIFNLKWTRWSENLMSWTLQSLFGSISHLRAARMGFSWVERISKACTRRPLKGSRRRFAS